MNLTKYFRPQRTLRGGMFLHEDAFDPGHRDFRPLPGGLPHLLRIPLPGDSGTPGRLMVASQNIVAAGQIIARSSAGDGVHAPFDGRVQSLTSVWTAGAGQVSAIEIATAADAEDRPAELFEGQLDAAPANRAEFVQRLRLAGAHVDDLARFVTGPAPRALIVCGLDTSPPMTARTEMAFRYGATVIETAALIHRLFGFYRTYLAVDRGYQSLVRLSERRSHGVAVRIAAIANKYPQAHPRLLVRTILARTLSPQQSPADIGVVVIDIADVIDMARALRDEPVTHRLISVAGHDLHEPGNYRVPIGIALADVLLAVGAPPTAKRIVLNCLWSGPALPDSAASNPAAVVARDTTAVLPLGIVDAPRLAACIRCGYCQDTCPVELDPLTLYRRAQRDGAAGSEIPNARACVECGLCDYVCPSDLPLMQGVQSLCSP